MSIPNHNGLLSTLNSTVHRTGERESKEIDAEFLKQQQEDAKLATCPKLSKKEIEVRKTILEKACRVNPKFKRDYKSFNFLPRDLIRFLWSHPFAPKILLNHTCLKYGSSLFVKDQSQFFQKIQVECPLIISQIGSRKTNEEVLVANLKEIFVEFLNRNSIETPKTPSGFVDDQILIQNYLEFHQIKNPLGELIHVIVNVGQDFQLILPIVTTGEMNFTQDTVHTVDSLRVFIYCDRFHCDNVQALCIKRTFIPKPELFSKLPFQKVLLDTRGISLANDREVTKISLQMLVRGFPNLHLDEEVKESFSRIAVRDRDDNYLNDATARTAGLMNWLYFLLELPEEAHPAAYSSAITQAEIKENALAALVHNRSSEQIRHILNWIHGVLFFEASENNDITHSAPKMAHEGMTGLCLRKENTHFFVRLHQPPLVIIKEMAKSWVHLEVSIKDEHEKKLLSQTITDLRCQKVTFSAKDKVRVCDTFIHRLHEKQESYKREELFHLFSAVRKIATQTLIRPILWEYQLQQHLQMASKERNDDETEHLLGTLASKKPLSEDNIKEIYDYISKNPEPKAVSENVKNAIISSLSLLFVKDSPEAVVQSIQRVFFLLEEKKYLQQKDRMGIFNLIIDFYLTNKHKWQNPALLRPACEFLRTVISWEEKPESFLAFANQLKKHIAETLPVLLKQLDAEQKQVDAEQNEMLAYRCVFTLLSFTPLSEVHDIIPEALEMLLEHATKGNERIDPQHKKSFQVQRVKILSAFCAMHPQKELLIRLEKYLVREMLYVMRYTEVANIFETFEDYAKFFLAHEHLENAPQRAEIYAQLKWHLDKKNDSFEFLQSLILIAMEIEPGLSAEMVVYLQRQQPGSAKLHACCYLSRCDKLSENDLSIYQQCISPYIEKDVDRAPDLLKNVFLMFSLLIKALQFNPENVVLNQLVDDLRRILERSPKILRANDSRFSEEENKQMQGVVAPALDLMLSLPHMRLEVIPLCDLLQPLTWLHRPVEDISIELCTRFEKEKSYEQIKFLYRQFQTRKYLDTFSIEGRLAVCKLLLNMPDDKLFLNAWEHVKELNLPVETLGIFVQKFKSNPKYFGHFHHLCTMRKETMKEYFSQYIETITALPPSSQKFDDLVAFEKNLQEFEEKDKAEKEENAFTPFRRQTHLELFKIAYETMALHDPSIKKENGSARLIEGLYNSGLKPAMKDSPIYKIKDLVKIMRDNIKQKLPSIMQTIDEYIVLLCLWSNDAELFKIAGEIILDSPIDQPTVSPQLIFFYVLQGLLTNDTKVRRKQALQVFKNKLSAFYKKILSISDETNNNYRDILVNKISCKESLRTLSHVKTAYRLTTTLFESEVERKKISSNLETNLLVFFSISREFAAHFRYTELIKIHELAKKCCPLDQWNSHLISLLEALCVQAALPNISLKKRIHLLKQINMILPLFKEAKQTDLLTNAMKGIQTITVEMLRRNKFEFVNEIYSLLREFHEQGQKLELFNNHNHASSRHALLAMIYLLFPSQDHQELKKMIWYCEGVVSKINVSSQTDAHFIEALLSAINLKMLFMSEESVGIEYVVALEVSFEVLSSNPEALKRVTLRLLSEIIIFHHFGTKLIDFDIGSIESTINMLIKNFENIYSLSTKNIHEIMKKINDVLLISPPNIKFENMHLVSFIAIITKMYAYMPHSEIEFCHQFKANVLHLSREIFQPKFCGTVEEELKRLDTIFSAKSAAAFAKAFSSLVPAPASIEAAPAHLLLWRQNLLSTLAPAPALPAAAPVGLGPGPVSPGPGPVGLGVVPRPGPIGPGPSPVVPEASLQQNQDKKF